MRSRKRLPVSGKLIQSFLQNRVVGTHISMFQKSTKYIAEQNLKTDVQSANFEKCTFEKIAFKVFGEYKDKKNSYLSTTIINLAVRRLKYTCTNPAKFIKICWTDSEKLNQIQKLAVKLQWSLKKFSKNVNLCNFRKSKFSLSPVIIVYNFLKYASLFLRLLHFCASKMEKDICNSSPFWQCK